MRESGILLPISALPSKYGIGCFSKEAYQFVDFLKAAGQKKWQILPMGPTSYGDSPYQSFSTFAGNPYFIDLDTLRKERYLTKKECEAYDFGSREDRVDYEKLYLHRFSLLRKAYCRFQKKPEKKYEAFVQKNAFWLEDYGLFMALKNHYHGAAWKDWDKELRSREPSALEKAKAVFAKEIDFYRFQQYMFYKQWKKLHRYANKNGIQIIGDLPIYVAFDSADTWASPELFQFTETHEPTAVAGCPPDAFSKTGQLWGNPLYDWKYHKETGYAWWIRRVKSGLKMCDMLRIDHFRGFDEYYSIPYGDKTAEFGTWKKGPGIDLFHAIWRAVGKENIIAEDLGYLTDSVMKLLKDTGYPGMKIIQFAFDSRESANYLPHTYPTSCVVYTGTHDNDTTKGWFLEAPRECRNFAREYLQKREMDPDHLSWDFIAMAMRSVANLCIIPIQDYLCLGSEARINTPSTLGGNWVWRLKKGQLTDRLAGKIRNMTKLYGRLS
ncbi:MAG: 4-alpha-glucanotransferase [Hespellia sp.]|nr:4-alpha-glucanotransferase [Hespellia sp.]